VGQGRRYGTDFDNGGFKVTREYSRIEFSDIVNGAVTIRSTYYDGIYNERRTVVSQGAVGVSRGVVAGLSWNENVEGRGPTFERWDRLGPTGLTLFDEEIEAIEAQIRSDNARRQQQRQNFDNGVAILTGVAAGVSGAGQGRQTSTSPGFCPNGQPIVAGLTINDCPGPRPTQGTGGGAIQ